MSTNSPAKTSIVLKLTIPPVPVCSVGNQVIPSYDTSHSQFATVTPGCNPGESKAAGIY